MFKDIKSNEEAKEFLQKELRLNREAGTYIFYGGDRGLLKLFAKAFAKGLNCDVYDDDFCGECESCKRIESETQGDFEILEDLSGIKIEAIRELLYKNSVTSYEGKNKIYVLRDIELMRKEASNALLKLIEEPNEKTFFILLANSLNILPTIKSRGILVNIKIQSAEDLEVSEFEYNFFSGNALDIEEYKKREDIDLNSTFSYEDIGLAINLWVENRDLKDKVDIYKSLRDFINVKDYLNSAEKIFFAEEIVNSNLQREEIKIIFSYLVKLLNPKNKKLEECLELKGMTRSPVNLKNLLITFFNKI